MTRESPKTELQLHLYREMSNISQGWVVLWVLIVIVIAFTGAVLYLWVFRREASAGVAIAVLDGIFGLGLNRIIKFHWPSEEASLWSELKKKLLGGSSDGTQL